MEEIKTNCVYCGIEYIQPIQFDGGDILDWCCSIECYDTHHSKQNKRNRLLDVIVPREIK
jgi:hypothetical protein